MNQSEQKLHSFGIMNNQFINVGHNDRKKFKRKKKKVKFVLRYFRRGKVQGSHYVLIS